MSAQDLTRSAVGCICLVTAFCLCSNVVRSDDGIACSEDLGFAYVATNVVFTHAQFTVDESKRIDDRGGGKFEHLSGVPLTLCLNLRWKTVEAGLDAYKLNVLPEHWYQSVQVSLSNQTDGHAFMLPAKLIRVGRRCAGSDEATWLISGSETLPLQGEYRAAARWRQGGPICEATVRFKDPQTPTERAYIELKKAQWAVNMEDNIQGALAFVSAATNIMKGPFLIGPLYLISSSVLRGKLFLRTDHFSEALFAYEENLRAQTYIPKEHEQYDSMVEYLEGIRRLANGSSSLRTLIPTNSCAEWRPGAAGEVKRLFLADDCFLDLVWCPPGAFIQGSPDDEVGRKKDENQRKVAITSGFWIGQSEISNSQWERIMQYSGLTTGVRDSRPKIVVSWFECCAFVRRLNTLFPQLTFRLPTEAEWEYACRAGSQTIYNCGNSLGKNDANFSQSGQYTNCFFGEVAFGVTKPNAWGIYAMHGNVWEWCQDWYGPYQSGTVTNPIGAVSGSVRVIRGGSWLSSSNSCRSAYRQATPPYLSSVLLGFRVVASVRE